MADERILTKQFTDDFTIPVQTKKLCSIACNYIYNHYNLPKNFFVYKPFLSYSYVYFAILRRFLSYFP